MFYFIAVSCRVIAAHTYFIAHETMSERPEQSRSCPLYMQNQTAFSRHCIQSILRLAEYDGWCRRHYYRHIPYKCIELPPGMPADFPAFCHLNPNPKTTPAGFAV